MNQNKRRTSLVVIGVLLIIAGIIIFIASAVQLHDVQTTTTHWAEGFMQDYQARTNATNSIPCYMFMILAVVMFISGVIMLCIKPKSDTVITSDSYNVSSQTVTYCPNCKSQINTSDLFCKNCGYDLKETIQSTSLETTCTNCGKINDSASKYCAECGQSL